MKSIVFVLWFFPGFIGAQVLLWSEVQVLRKAMFEDSLAKVEYLAARQFHHLLNNYRIENGLDTLAFDPIMWLTCRNHGLYMRQRRVLDHAQGIKTEYFTGKMPGERYAWVAGGKAPEAWSGENILMNYSAYGKSIREIAGNVARSSLNQWKNSKPHNQNMLGRHGKHAVAFVFRDNQVWGTSMFTYGGMAASWPE